MSSSGVYVSYDANRKQNREDLLDVITDLSPTETPVYRDLEKGRATNPYHEFLSYSVPRATSTGATVEGADITFSALSTPTRNVNYVQEITVPYKISYLQEKADTAGGKEMPRRRVEAMKKWKLAMEYSLIFGSGVSGASDTARTMKGILASLSKATSNSLASLSESKFNDFLNEIWNEVTDDDYSAYLDMRIKRHITSNFTSTTTRNINSGERKLINSIDVYESDVAKMVRLNGHRDLSSTNRFFVIQPKAFKVAMYENPRDIEVAPDTGNWTGGKVYGSATLEFLYPKAGISVTNVG